MDTVVAFELVLPDGEITTVTAESNPELSFALKVSDPLPSYYHFQDTHSGIRHREDITIL
jgi:hypothetical protein